MEFTDQMKLLRVVQDLSLGHASPSDVAEMLLVPKNIFGADADDVEEDSE